MASTVPDMYESRLLHAIHKTDADVLKVATDQTAFSAAGFNKIDADLLKTQADQSALTAAGFNKLGVDSMSSQYDQTNALVANADRAAIAVEQRMNRSTDALVDSIRATGMNNLDATNRLSAQTATLAGDASTQAERINSQTLTGLDRNYGALTTQNERINGQTLSSLDRNYGALTTQNERIGAAGAVQAERIAGASALQASTLASNGSIQAERIAGASSVQAERIAGANSAQAERIGAAGSLQAERIGAALSTGMAQATLANATAHALTQREQAVGFMKAELDALRNNKSMEEKIVSTTDSVKDLIRGNEEERLRDRIRALELVALAEPRHHHDSHCGVPWVGVQGAYNFPGVSPTQFDGNLRTPRGRSPSRSRSRGRT